MGDPYSDDGFSFDHVLNGKDYSKMQISSLRCSLLVERFIKINRANVIGIIWSLNPSNSWRLHFTLVSVLLVFYYKPFFLLALAHGNAERGESLGGLGFTRIRQAFAYLSRK